MEFARLEPWQQWRGMGFAKIWHKSAFADKHKFFCKITDNATAGH